MDGGYIFEVARLALALGLAGGSGQSFGVAPVDLASDDAVRHEVAWCTNAEALSRGAPPMTQQDFDAVYAAHGVPSPPATEHLLWPDWACGDRAGIARLRGRLQGAGRHTPTTWRTLPPPLAALTTQQYAHARALAALPRSKWGDLLPVIARLRTTYLYPAHVADLDTLAALRPDAAHERVVLNMFSAWALHSAPIDANVDYGARAPLHALADADLVAAFVVAYRRTCRAGANTDSSAEVARIIVECRARTCCASRAFASWSFVSLFCVIVGDRASRPARQDTAEKLRLAERGAEVTAFARKATLERLSHAGMAGFQRTWLGRKLSAYLE